MKLVIYGKDNEEEYLEVSFWSFVKCYVLANIAVQLIIAGIVALLSLILLYWG